ncbi:MAG TPA: D-alanyl-D-alanine carboxypeptidase family protein [Acidimicrobiales bacterium]|nr:D-alanyl-D-alanine carboxypeptidase family protein [Acidimicrobiales bacterium]
MTGPRYVRFVALAIVLLLAPLAAATPASAAKSKVEQARESAKAIRAQLARVTAELQRQEARRVAATQAASAARTRLSRARAQEAAVQHRLVEVTQSLKGVALQVYMSGDPRQATGALFDPVASVRAQYLRSAVVGVQTDAADALKATRQDLESKRRAAEVAARVASNRQQAVGRAVSALRSSQAQQLRLVGAAESRYLASLKESQLATRTRRPRGGSVSLTTVRGITVATSIADNLERMLSAADGDGMRFGGSGYRSSSGQVAARRRNCGSSDYDVYEKPSSRCHPPTAKPGQSMHEQGLAIDFTYNGSIINSRSNPGFQWLRANAARFGFYNLPSEAWHWSINGN